MVRLAVPVSLLALAALGACSTPPQTGGPSQSMPNVVTNVHPYHAGNGTVQSVVPTPAGMAAAGSSAESMQRLEIRMDDGRIQYVDTASREFAKGTRIHLSDDKVIRKL